MASFLLSTFCPFLDYYIPDHPDVDDNGKPLPAPFKIIFNPSGKMVSLVPAAIIGTYSNTSVDRYITFLGAENHNVATCKSFLHFH